VLEVLAPAATVLVAGFTQGATGFGFGIVAMAVLPLVLGVKFAVPLVALLGIVLNGTLFWHFRRHVERRRLLPLVLGAPIGAPLGVTLLSAAGPALLMAVLGVVLVGYALLELLGRREKPDREPPGRGWGFAAGVAGGLLGGAFNTGGPPVILYGAASRWPQGTFKGVLQAYFLAVSVLQIGMLAANGLIVSEHLLLDAALLAPMGVGVWLGVKASGRLDRDRFRRLVLFAILALGAVFVYRAAG
jgi:uncharacterized membrane protein YfcA